MITPLGQQPQIGDLTRSPDLGFIEGMKGYVFFLSAVFAFSQLLAGEAATTVSLPVANPSFEALTGTNLIHFDADGHLRDGHYSAFDFATGTGFNSTRAIPGWSGSGSAGTFNPSAAEFPRGVTDGKNTAWINASFFAKGQITQTLPNRFLADRTYRLSVDVGAPAGLGFPGYFIGLYANGRAVAADTNSVTVAKGRFATATVVVTLSADSPFIGAPIEIRLGLPDLKPDQTDFDNVRLTVDRLPVGETATAVATITAGFVSGITMTSGGSGYTNEPVVTLSGGGGSGASAKPILAGDTVASIVVLTAGSGYATAPTVVIEAPPKALSVRLRWVPELTVEGPAGSQARVESATGPTGPWTTWTNVTVGATGTVLVDLSPGSVTRFYRSVAE